MNAKEQTTLHSTREILHVHLDIVTVSLLANTEYIKCILNNMGEHFL